MKPPSLPSSKPRAGYKPTRASGKSSIDVIEEATGLLRKMPARSWLLFYAFSLPFILGVIFFWSDMTGAGDAAYRLVGESLLLAILYVLMKCGHAGFDDHLLSRLRRDSELPARLGPLQWLRLAASQGLIHATMPWMMLFSSFAVLPFAWAYAFYRNVSVFACGHMREKGSFAGLVGRSLRAAHHAPGSNHVVLMILSLVALLLWMNAMMLTLLIPQLAGILTGIEFHMNSSPRAMLNTTFVATSVVAAWLVVSPVFHACYVVRCFESDSVKSGEDLMAGLRTLRLRSVLPVVMLGMLLMSQHAGSAEAITLPTVERSEQLDRALDETLDQAEFRWRMPHQIKPENEMNWFERTIADFTRSLSNMVDAVVTWVEDLMRWLLERDDDKPAVNDNGGSWLSDPANARLLLVLLIVCLVIVLAVFIIRWAAARRALPKVEVTAVPEIDLRDDSVIATDLPEDEWLRMANEQLALGDLRLALRALFLGTLARLGSRELIIIAPGKTNGMYIRELTRRARATDTNRSAFKQSVRLFEHCWYGLHAPSQNTLEEIRNHHDTICQDARTDQP